MKETEAERARRYRREHPEKVAETTRRYRVSHKEEARIRLKEYRLKNPDKVKKWGDDAESKRTQKYRDDPVFYIWRSAKFRAKKLGIAFEIEPSDIKFNNVCPITGETLNVFSNNMTTSMSLDKVDNTKGYIKGNVQIISRKANRLKGDGTIEQFKRLIAYMEASGCV